MRLLSKDVRHALKDNFKGFRPWIPPKRSFDDHLSKLVAQEFDFDHYDWAAIKIGEKSINPLYSREVAEVLEEAGMQHCSVCIEWSFGHSGEEEHKLKKSSHIATKTCGEFLVVDSNDKKKSRCLTAVESSFTSLILKSTTL